MLGRLEFVSGTRGQGEWADLHGLPVLRVQTDPEGCLGKRRLDRAGRFLYRSGAARVLLPPGFDRWELLKKFSLRPVDPAPFLRARAPELALAGLKRRDVAPERATVALVGRRADGEMARAAVRLCRDVRRLVIAAPGGEALARGLREEFGIPVLPPEQPAEMELCFHPGARTGTGPRMELYGLQPELDGGSLTFPELGEEEGGDLCLLCALWERGRLDVQGLKFM